MKKSSRPFDSLEATGAAIFDRAKAYIRGLSHKDGSELLGMATDIVKHVAEAVEKPTRINIVKCGFNIWRTIDNTKTFAEEYFHPDWVYPYTRQFNEFIVEAVSAFPYKVIHSADTDTLVKIATVYGEEVGWIYSATDKTVSGVYVQNIRQEEACLAIKKALWDRMAYKSIVMEKMPPKGSAYSESVNFKSDTDLIGLESAKADEYSRYLQRCMDAGVPRTVLFYGHPGTGKSTISRAIADRLNLKTLRIRVEDISDFDNKVIFEAINVFEPDAVILDDLDRAPMQSHLLEMMDRFHKHIKLVFATVNHLDALDEALMRPGRFDEVCHIRRLDDVVIKKMLGEENQEMFDTVKDWPIAFIQEYVTRRRFMDKDEAAATAKELKKRVERLGVDESDETPEESDESSDDVVNDIESTLVTLVDSAQPEKPGARPTEIPDFVKRYVKQIKLRRT